MVLADFQLQPDWWCFVPSGFHVLILTQSCRSTIGHTSDFGMKEKRIGDRKNSYVNVL